MNDMRCAPAMRLFLTILYALLALIVFWLLLSPIGGVISAAVVGMKTWEGRGTVRVRRMPDGSSGTTG